MCGVEGDSARRSTVRPLRTAIENGGKIAVRYALSQEQTWPHNRRTVAWQGTPARAYPCRFGSLLFCAGSHRLWYDFADCAPTMITV